MAKNSTKQSGGQRKFTRSQTIENEQNKWFRDAEQAAQAKADIGYESFAVDAFLEIIPDDSLDTAIQSQILTLQEDYRELKERQKILWAEDGIVAEFNKTHAVVHVDQTYILTEKINYLGGQDFSLESRLSFKTYYEDERIMCPDGTERSKADIWLQSSKRRKYKGIIFDPRATESKEYYNLWRGFAKSPHAGNCEKYWAHVKDNICAGDEVAYQYLRKWLACVFQHPHVVHTAIVLCGSQGVGKNRFVEPLGQLLGTHYTPLSNISELISNFNNHLKNAVLIHANEALWGGHKKDIGTVKAMITEEHCLIESKGKDRIRVRNFKHVILSSNEDWPVHMDRDDRRFFVLQVSEAHKEDHAYFKAMQEELDNEGLEALLFDLLNEDISNFDPRKLPSSHDSFHIKLRSADSVDRYVYEVLNEGGFSIGKTDGYPVWQDVIPKDSVYEDYALWCQKSNEPQVTRALFGRSIKKLISSIDDTRPGGESRIRCYKLPELDHAREDFSEAFKERPEQIFDNYVGLMMHE